MIKFDKKACMVIVSTDEIKYQTRVSNKIAFGSPWLITTSISFHNKKPRLCYAFYKTAIVVFCRVQTVTALARLSLGLLHLSISLLLSIL